MNDLYWGEGVKRSMSLLSFDGVSMCHGGSYFHLAPDAAANTLDEVVYQNRILVRHEVYWQYSTTEGHLCTKVCPIHCYCLDLVWWKTHGRIFKEAELRLRQNLDLRCIWEMVCKSRFLRNKYSWKNEKVNHLKICSIHVQMCWTYVIICSNIFITFLLVICGWIVTWHHKTRSSSSLSVAYTSLWVICWSCSMLLDCEFLCEGLELDFLECLVSVPLFALPTQSNGSQQ